MRPSSQPMRGDAAGCEASAGRGCAATSARSASRSPVDGAGGAGLHQHVAQRGGLDRAGQHRQPAAVGDQPGRAGRSGRRRRRRGRRRPCARTGRRPRSSAVRERRGQAVDDAAHQRRRGRPAPRTSCSAHQAAIRRRHVARRQEPRVLHVEHRHRRGHRGGLGQQRRRGRRLPVRSQPRRVSRAATVPITLVRKRIRAVDAALVGEVGRAGLLGEHRRVELDADQPPGAAGDVRRVVARSSGRRPPPRRCRASRPRDGRPGAPSCSADVGQHRADHGRPGPRAAANSPAGRPSRSISSAVPLPVRTSSSPVVEALVRSVTGPAGQPVAEQVGHQQQPVRLGRPSGSAASW